MIEHHGWHILNLRETVVSGITNVLPMICYSCFQSVTHADRQWGSLSFFLFILCGNFHANLERRTLARERTDGGNGGDSDSDSTVLWKSSSILKLLIVALTLSYIRRRGAHGSRTNRVILHYDRASEPAEKNIPPRLGPLLQVAVTAVVAFVVVKQAVRW